jgi:transcriptional regulator with XRE-family HTH domain
MPDSLSVQTCKNIVSAREAAGMTQQQMAKGISVCLRQYQYVEAGGTALTLERLGRIAAILDCSPADLISKDFSPKKKKGGASPPEQT